MVDRILEYPIEVPICEDDLRTNRNFMVGLGKLAEVLTGKQTVLQGLLCKPTIPASLSVLVEPGQIFSWQNIDNSAYSELPEDTDHQIIKQGLILDETELPCPAPVTVGFSINYLVQIKFNEVDSLNEERAFYNSDDPTQPEIKYKDSQREDKCIVAVKAGVAAATGTQVTPSPDTDFVGAWVVTVDEGQTEITANDIVEYPDAPFYRATSTIHTSNVTNDGSNNYSGISKPPVSQYENGLTVIIIPDTPNTGDSTLDLGYGAIQILDLDGNALHPEELLAGTPYIVVYMNGKWIIQVTSTYTINLFPEGYYTGLSVQNDAGDLLHDINFGVGAARDFDDTIDMINTTPMIKQIDAPWAPGTNAGGFPSGLTLQPNTYYHLFMIGKVDKSVDFGFDSNLDASALLADAIGFSGYFRVGSVKTDASSNIKEFKMFIIGKQRIFRWLNVGIDYNVVAPGTAPVLVTLEVPPDVRTVAQFMVDLATPITGTTVIFTPPDITVLPIGPYGQIRSLAGQTDVAQADVVTNLTRQIRYVMSASHGTTVMDLLTLGWTE